MNSRQLAILLFLIVFLAIFNASKPVQAAGTYTIKQLTDNTLYDAGPIVEDGNVVWSRHENGMVKTMFYNGASTIPLFVGAQPTDMGNGQILMLGPLIDSQIYFYDGAQTFPITSDNTRKWNPDLHNGQVVWTSSQNGFLPWDAPQEVFLYK